LLFGALLDDFIMDGLGVARNIRARLVERALFEDGILIIRRHLCG